jgi:hypothetical protein
MTTRPREESTIKNQQHAGYREKPEQGRSLGAGPDGVVVEGRVGDDQAPEELSFFAGVSSRYGLSKKVLSKLDPEPKPPQQVTLHI